MERFQKIKIARKKLDVNSICRCCGLENEEKFNILSIDEEGVEFKEKYLNMIGVNVERGDSLPQSICGICYDKISDFYEFRTMAQNTEAQTRQALRLPLIEPKSLQQEPTKRTPVDPKSAVVKLVDLKYSIEDKILIQKAFRRISMMKFDSRRVENRSESPAVSVKSEPPTKKIRKDIQCKICSEYFAYPADLQDHESKEHLPLISRYACGSCRETFEQLSDYKEHETKHSRENLKYKCFICSATFAKIKEFDK